MTTPDQPSTEPETDAPHSPPSCEDIAGQARAFGLGDYLNDRHTVLAALAGAVSEVLVGPLAAGPADPGTMPSLVTFTMHALGGNDARNP